MSVVAYSTYLKMMMLMNGITDTTVRRCDMTNGMPKTVTVTKTFTYDVAEWIAEYEMDIQNGGRVHPHNHGEYDVRYIIPPLDTSNFDEVVEWITDEATSDNWHVSTSQQSVTITID